MKRLVVLLAALFIMVGCGQLNEPNQQDHSTKESIQEKQEIAVEHETFLEDEYIDYPGVKNIVKYLKIDSQDVKILHQTDQRLVFCFYREDEDVHDETVLSVYNYIKELEKQWNKEALPYDGTISSTFVLEKDNYELKVKTIYDVETWKKDWDEYDTKDMKDENIVCEVRIMKEG